jgi:hypothetical protein
MNTYHAAFWSMPSDVTELPTIKGPSSVARKSRDPGPGRRVSVGPHGHGEGYGRGQDPAMETGGNSKGGTAAIPGVSATRQA